MIKPETITINGREYTRKYSDENRYLVRDGVSYTEAVDPINSGREYTEGDVIPNHDKPAPLETEQIAKTLQSLPAKEASVTPEG